MADPRRTLRRLPLRVKLTLVYALVVCVALAGIAGVVYLRFEAELNRTIDADLRSRAQALAALVSQQGPAVIGGEAGQQLLRPQGAFAQVARVPGGRVVQATPSVAGLRLLSPAGARAATQRGVVFNRTGLPGIRKQSRLVAEPVARRAGTAVVVGRSLKDREGANESFAKALLIGGPLALLFASLAGYGLATAALRPVESMRRRAATISTAEPGARLPVPDADDELGRLGRTLNEMLARLEHAFAQQRALTANASHELRTPLAVISSTLEVALRRARSREEMEAVMREALAQTQRLAQLAEDLLVLARLDEQEVGAERATVAVDEVVARVIGRLQERAARDGRIIDAMPSALHVSADPRQVEQAVENLVANALVHGQGTVMVRPQQAGGRVAIHVLDEGPAIDAELSARAFDRFVRGGDAHHRPGSGLGLSIVAAVATAHGGAVGVGDDGTADFWIALPVSSPGHASPAPRAPGR